MSVEQLTQAAVSALAEWGGCEGVPKLVSHRENAVFEVRLKSGEKVALRLHRPGYNSSGEIKSEIWWTHELATFGFLVPVPIPASDGRLLANVEDGQTATAISWVDGDPIGASGASLDGSLSEQVKLYQQVGSLLAELHNITDKLSIPEEFERRNWDSDGFLGEDPLWGKFWENPALDKVGQELVQTARTEAIADLTRYKYEGADFGLIHADAVRENVFNTAQGLCLIDFDDAGFGFRLYDLTTALSQSVEDVNYADLMDAVLDGYGRLRPLSNADRERTALFRMLRAFASMGWAVPRMSPDSPEFYRYVRRALVAAEQYLDRPRR